MKERTLETSLYPSHYRIIYLLELEIEKDRGSGNDKLVGRERRAS